VPPTTTDGPFTPTSSDSAPPVNFGVPTLADGGRLALEETGVTAVSTPKVSVSAGEGRFLTRGDAIVPLILVPDVEVSADTPSVENPAIDTLRGPNGNESSPEVPVVVLGAPSIASLLEAALPVNLDDLGVAVRTFIDGLDDVRTEFEWLIPDTESAVVLLGVAAGLAGYELRRRRTPATWPTPFDEVVLA
jgi:hypothetical protein